MKALIIGCGNEDRGDDAAGVLVARRLRELGVDTREHGRDGISLLESWTEADAVVLIDAVTSGASPGAVHRWEGLETPLAQTSFRGSSHSIGVAEALRLAAELGRLPASITVYGIEGECFDHGAGPGEPVLRAVEEVAQRIASEVRA